MKKHCGLVNGEYIPAPRIQDALSHQLKALGFNAMAEDVLTEGDRETLKKYARVIAKNSPKDPSGAHVVKLLMTLGLL